MTKIITNPRFHTPLSELRQYSEDYKNECTKFEPLYSGWTVYGDASLYECHKRGEENTVVLVIDGKAYSTDQWEYCELLD